MKLNYTYLCCNKIIVDDKISIEYFTKHFSPPITFLSNKYETQNKEMVLYKTLRFNCNKNNSVSKRKKKENNYIFDNVLTAAK